MLVNVAGCTYMIPQTPWNNRFQPKYPINELLNWWHAGLLCSITHSKGQSSHAEMSNKIINARIQCHSYSSWSMLNDYKVMPLLLIAYISDIWPLYNDLGEMNICTTVDTRHLYIPLGSECCRQSSWTIEIYIKLVFKILRQPLIEYMVGISYAPSLLVDVSAQLWILNILPVNGQTVGVF